jgi:hypothetical protein
MKKALILLSLSLCVLVADAQSNGGFGYFVAGVAGNTNTKVQSRLQGATLLGNGFTFNNPGLHIGGRGLAVFGKFVMGGGGYGSSFTGSTNAGEARLSIGGGFFDVGYFLMKKPQTQLYTFVGFGGGGGSLKVTNTSALSMSFAPNQIISANENREINQGGFGFEFGIGVNQFVIGKTDESGSGGFMVGLLAGANFFPSSEWEFEANGTNVTNMGNMSSFYIGLTIGGGGFR